MAPWRRGAILTWCLTVVWLWFDLGASSLTSGDFSSLGDLLAIPVQDGVATVDLPTSSERDQYLVIISSLSRSGGPYTVEVETKPIAQPKPLPAVVNQLDHRWEMQVQQRRKQLSLARQTVQPVAAGVPAEPPSERRFWIMVRGDDFANAANYELVRARLERTGRDCSVYVDVQCPRNERIRVLVRECVSTFDEEVYPTAVRLLGRHRDVDRDGRFVVLFTPWLARLAGGTVSLGGFVRGSDFFEDVEPPLGNRCDMMYLNSELDPGPHLRTLIAHEYTHAVTLSEHVFARYLPDRMGQEEESWLDESLAHLAENLHGYSWSNLDYRISAFLSDPESYRLVVDDYYAAGLWRGHGNRGSTYLFLRWCVDQFGEGILQDLVQTNLCGVESLEVATGRPFPELFREWSAALFLANSGLASRREQELRFLDTRGELSGRLLAGPHYEYLRLDGDRRRFQVAGTSPKYFMAHSPVQVGSRVRVISASDAELQVSVRRLPVDLARLEVQATLNEASGPPRGVASYRIRVRELNGTPVRLEKAAWERSSRGTNRDGDKGSCGHVLDGVELRTIFGDSLIPAWGTRVAEDLRIEPEPPAGRSLLLKITGRDNAGHAVSAWCPIPPRPNGLEQTVSAVVPLSR